jgi:hypothetical protein
LVDFRAILPDAEVDRIVREVESDESKRGGHKKP